MSLLPSAFEINAFTVDIDVVNSHPSAPRALRPRSRPSTEGTFVTHVK